MFTDSLAPDVFAAYQVEIALIQIEERKYDFSQVDLLKDGSLRAPMDSWDEDVRKEHQVTVAVKVWDRAIFNSENSSAGVDRNTNRYTAMEKWLSFLCIDCGPDDVTNESMLCPVLGRSSLCVWRLGSHACVCFARLCLFRSLVLHSLGTVHTACLFARPLGVRLHSAMFATQCLLPFVCDSVLTVDPSRAPVFVCVLMLVCGLHVRLHFGCCHIVRLHVVFGTFGLSQSQCLLRV